VSEIGDILKPIIGAAWQSANPAREAVTQVYALGIEKITGEKPVINRLGTKTVITWQPGQANKMQKFIARTFIGTAKAAPAVPSKEFSLSEVQVDMKPVIMPLIFKTILPFMATYTVLIWYVARRKAHGGRSK